MKPRVTVMRDKFVSGWPDEGKKPAGKVYVLELGAALTRSYTSDAHCAQYATHNGHRLTKEAILRGAKVEMTCMIFDVDDPETHGTPIPASDAWRQQMRMKMAELYDAHPGMYYYETKGGARIVYALEKPIFIASTEDAQEWSQRYAIVSSYLSRRFGVDADASCGDWPRLFRLPHATREPGGKPEQREVVGDPDDIGILKVKAAIDDYELALERSKSFKEVNRHDFSPSDGRGILYHALRNRGYVLRPHSRGHIIRCPQEALHSSGKPGDSSTVLYMPAVGERIGAINCLHAHCSHMTVKDWLRCFSKDELRQAEVDAGLEREEKPDVR